MMPEPMSDEQRVEMQAMARQAKEVAPKVPLSALYVERLADSILSLLTALEAAEARIVRLEIERNEWRRLFNDQPEFLTAVDCRLLAENERDALRAQLAAMEKERDEWCGIATDWKERLAAAAEEAARLRKALDLAGRKISGAALHQMHEHAEAEVREALRSMSDTLNATPSTGEAVREAVRALEMAVSAARGLIEVLDNKVLRKYLPEHGALDEMLSVARSDLATADRALRMLRERGLA